MDIKLHNIPVKDIFEGYVDAREQGVVGYSGKLDIRPQYQREFIYSSDQQEEVINSVMNGFPLNTMYWSVVNDENNKFSHYELMDGQQRTLSVMKYINNEYGVNYINFNNLPEDKQKKILNYEFTIYICEGTESEKLKWFETVNIAGETLTDQELLNAIYAGSFVSDAKRYFSKPNAPARDIGENYINGNPLRQDYLEKALNWISDGDIRSYMSKHQHDDDASQLWLYYSTVMEWAKTLFPNDYNELKRVQWGNLYNKYKNNQYSISQLSNEVEALMLDDDVTRQVGIFEYVLQPTDEKNESLLNIRSFTDAQKRRKYKEQNKKCQRCGEEFSYKEMEGDHITPWSLGGSTDDDNLQMLCKDCNRRKSNV